VNGGFGGRRVAITGVGVVSAYGRGPAALWRGLSGGATAIAPHRARFGGRTWLDYNMARLSDDVSDLAADLPNRPLVESQRLSGDPDLVAIAEAVRQAIDDAGLEYDRETNDVGIVVTHESPGLADHLQGFFRFGEAARAWLRSPARFDPPEFLYRLKSESVYRMHSFLYIHWLSAIFGLHGFSLYNNNACASGAYSLAVAADRIRSGEASAVVVAGGDVPEDGTKYRWFRDLGLYSHSGRCRPFHAERDGLVLGSGAAAFVLEELESAVRAGRRVWAEWRGGGFTSEGWKVTLPDPDSGRYAEAMSRALAAAGMAPGEVDLVCPHGVGSGLLDGHEARSLAAVFGQDGEEWPALIAPKAAVGHTLGGCALVETLAALLALAEGEVPELVRCAEVDPSLPLGHRSANGALPREWVMLKCTNGFAGQNGAFVLASA
jgi:3-oxoacyl-[acyl-carrier-protein] synthase II